MIRFEEIEFRLKITKTDETFCGIIYSKTNNKNLGSFDFYRDNKTFYGSINILSNFQNKGIGFYVFNECIKEFSKQCEINYFRALWTVDVEYNHLSKGQSINYLIYKNLVENGIFESEALWLTPTGKWLKKLNFKNAKLIEMSETRIIVDYKK